jgi:peroxiredoxin
LVETIVTDSNGEFLYNFDDNEFGLYRIYLENDETFDIVYYNEDIEIVTLPKNPQHNMMVIKSEENKQLYEYLSANSEYEYKIEVLDQFINIYPDGKFLETVKNELKKELENKNKNIIKAINQNPKSFAGRYLSYFKEFMFPAKYSDLQKREYIKSEYLSNYKLNDLEMLNSDAYNHLVITYLKQAGANNSTLYYQSAEKIMNKVMSENPKISKFILEYILSGFEIMGFQQEAVSLSLKFGDLCSDDDENFKIRIKNNIKLAVGENAPDFSHTTISGKNYTLSNMTANYTIIIFWATWCEHCKATLPKLAKDMHVFGQVDVDLIAISVDTDRVILNEFLNENEFPFEIICDFKGWDGDIVKDYAIYATPMIFIVDKELKIVSKPFNESRLYNEITRIVNQ